LTEPPLIVPKIVTNVPCAGDSGTASVSASGGVPPYSYLWNTAPVQTAASVSGLSAGTYTVTITDATGCSKTAAADINMALRFSRQSFNWGTGCMKIVSDDFNSDGKPDIVVLNSTPKTISFCSGDGAGNFTWLKDFPAGTNAFDMIEGDFNADGKADIVTSGADSVYVLFGNGAGSFSAYTHYVCNQSSQQCLAASDINSDGKIDLVVASGNNTWFSVLINNGTGGFNAPVQVNTYGPPFRSILSRDLNNDGKADVAGLFWPGFNQLGIYFGDGAGSFTHSLYTSMNNPTSFTTADLDGDGLQDIIVTNNDSLAVFKGITSAPYFSNAVYHSSGTYITTSVIAADFNWDGKPDVAAANNYTAGGISVFTGDGAGSFSVQDYYSAGQISSQKIIAADLNMDGLSDIISSNSSSTLIDVLMNCSSAAGVEEMKGSADEILVYPNPSRGEFVVKTEEIKGQREDVKLEIYNVLGGKVYSADQPPNLSIISISLPSGMGKGVYFLRAKTKDRTCTKKIVLY
jgi:hypothetical protein